MYRVEITQLKTPLKVPDTVARASACCGLDFKTPGIEMSLDAADRSLRHGQTIIRVLLALC